MSSTKQTLVRMVNRGFDQSKQRHLTEPNTMWDGLNLHQVNGRLEQTPWLENLTTLSLLNASELAATQVKVLRLVQNSAGALKYLVVNSYNARYVDPASPGTQTLIPYVQINSSPGNNTLRTQCLLYGYNSTDFNVVGDTITVYIDSATTFIWRRNAGPWSASLPIQQDTVIGANGLHVSFQGEGATTDFTGYSIGSTWTWLYWSYINGYNAVYGDFGSSDVYGTDVYISVGRQILRLRDDFLTDVGYHKVFGKHVAIFYGHLFVSHYATQDNAASAVTVDPYNAKTTPFVLGWSHLNNPDQFFSTLINEADQKQLQQQQFSDLTRLGITGLAQWRSQLYVFLADAIWSFQYVGLPNVMQSAPLNSNIGCVFQSGVVRTPQAIYFVGRNDFYRITDFEPESIGVRVRNKFYTEICPIDDSYFQKTVGHYNPEAKEVTWTYYIKISVGNYQARQIVYNEQTDDWHFRNMPCTYASYAYLNPSAACAMYNTYGRSIYGYNGALAIDQADGATSNAIKDTVSSSVAAYTQPYFETPFLSYGDYFHIKQSDTLYIDASWDICNSMKIGFASKNMIGNSTTTFVTVSQSWGPNLVDTRLSLPRAAYRSLAYRFTFENGTSAAYGCKYNFYQEFFLGPQLSVEK